MFDTHAEAKHRNFSTPFGREPDGCIQLSGCKVIMNAAKECTRLLVRGRASPSVEIHRHDPITELPESVRGLHVKGRHSEPVVYQHDSLTGIFRARHIGRKGLRGLRVDSDW